MFPRLRPLRLASLAYSSHGHGIRYGYGLLHHLPFSRPPPITHLRLSPKGLLDRNFTSTSTSHVPYSSISTTSARVNHPPPPIPPFVPASKHLLSRRARRLLYITTTLATIYFADKYLNYSTLIRTLRTLRTSIVITLDYKLNFTRHKSSDQLSQLHSRNADRIVSLCLTNGGLYQKIGQAIAMQSALLPSEFREKFALFFSETPQASRAEVEKVLRDEYHQFKDPVNELFVPGTFSNRALGSASIAQVHKAQLQTTGEWVAVKIQKPGISRQVGWDLWVFRLCMDVFSQRLFGLPLGFVTPFICERLLSETDFRIEARNSEVVRELIFQEFGPEGKIPGGKGGRVYVPKVYHEYSTKRVMVAEWIDGVLLSDRKAVTGPYRPHQSHPTTTTTTIVPTGIGSRRIITTRRSSFDSPSTSTSSGLGLSSHEVMRCILTLFSKMMFNWGHVHCDPHPGNILIRRLPSPDSTPTNPISLDIPQIVLLDHGLYVHLHPHLRTQYARLWTALLSLDITTVTEITKSWGFDNAEMVASMTMLRPWRGEMGVDLSLDEEGRELSAYERQLRVKEAMTKVLTDEGRVPRELVFLGRCMRILQANNQLLSSPINRLKLLANFAALSLLPSGPNHPYVDLPPSSLSPSPDSLDSPPSPTPNLPLTRRIVPYLYAYLRHIIFKFTLLLLDIGFWWTRVRQYVLGGKGFEEELEERMRNVAKKEWGVEIGGGMFEG